MLKARLLYGILMIVFFLAILLGDLVFAPYYPLFGLLLATIVLLATTELCGLLGQLGLRLNLRFCQLGSLAVIASPWLAPWLPRESLPWLNLAAPAVVFVIVCMLAFVLSAWTFQAPGSSVLSIAAHILIVTYVGLLGSFVAQIRWMWESPELGTMAFFLVIFTAKFCDIGAYFTGRLIGRHKLAPVLSPGKTLEGSAGGLLFAVGLALLGVTVGKSITGQQLLDLRATIIFGVIVGLTAQIGDLMESLIKRDCQQKDASSSIPGFGGVLDIIDSILFCGPVAFLLFAGL
jgi:phosphatidate cytidylyltransferase